MTFAAGYDGHPFESFVRSCPSLTHASRQLAVVAAAFWIYRAHLASLQTFAGHHDGVAKRGAAVFIRRARLPAEQTAC